MARARNIKPAFFVNPELAELDPLARLLFIGLWCLADKDGRLKDKPKVIKIQILPWDDVNVDGLLFLLAPEFIRRYEVNGERYIQINNFCKHQNPHQNEKSWGFPEFSEQYEITPVISSNYMSNPDDSLYIDSLNIESCNMKDVSKDTSCPENEPEKNDAIDGDCSVDSGDATLLNDNQYGRERVSEPDVDSDSDLSKKLVPFKPKKYPTLSKLMKDGGAYVYPPEFEQFWDEYPRRAEKTVAYKAWVTRVNEEGHDPHDIFIAAQNYRDYVERQGLEQVHIKLPATFVGTGKPFLHWLNPQQERASPDFAPAWYGIGKELIDLEGGGNIDST